MGPAGVSKANAVREIASARQPHARPKICNSGASIPLVHAANLRRGHRIASVIARPAHSEGSSYSSAPYLEFAVRRHLLRSFRNDVIVVQAEIIAEPQNETLRRHCDASARSARAQTLAAKSGENRTLNKCRSRRYVRSSNGAATHGTQKQQPTQATTVGERNSTDDLEGARVLPAHFRPRLRSLLALLGPCESLYVCARSRQNLDSFFFSRPPERLAQVVPVPCGSRM